MLSRMSDRDYLEERAERGLRLGGSRVVLRPRDVARADADRYFALWCHRRVARGLYVSQRMNPAYPLPVAFVLAVHYPDAIVCLLSALELQGLMSLSTDRVWLARTAPDWRPRGLVQTRVEAVQFAPTWAQLGVEMAVHRGIRVGVTRVARTVADLFAYRTRVGTDAAVQALEEAVRLRACSVFELEAMLRARRVHAYARPLLKAAQRRWPQPSERGPRDYERCPWLPRPAYPLEGLPRRLRFPWAGRGSPAELYDPVCEVEPRRTCACRFLPAGRTLDGRRCVCGMAPA